MLSAALAGWDFARLCPQGKGREWFCSARRLKGQLGGARSTVGREAVCKTLRGSKWGRGWPVGAAPGKYCRQLPAGPGETTHRAPPLVPQQDRERGRLQVSSVCPAACLWLQVPAVLLFKPHWGPGQHQQHASLANVLSPCSCTDSV